LTNWS